MLMKNDFEILQQILAELKRVDKPPFAPLVIELYGRLIERVPEDGFELFLPDKDLSQAEEQVLQELNHYGYFEIYLRHQLTEGLIYNVNLRGKRFLEIANTQTRCVVIDMKDSGTRETFETGAVRDSDEGKPRPELISPFAIERLSHWLRMGAEKYAPRNWEKGLPISRSMSSLCRHLMKYQQGCTDEDHIAAILCNAMFIAHTEEMCKRGVLPKTLLDMPDYQKPHAHDEPYDY